MRWIEDHPYGEKTPFWTRANAGEVLPLPPSPLGWDLVFANGGMVAGWRDCAVDRLGIGDDSFTDKDRCDFIGVIGGYGYLGATWIRVWAERTPGLSADDIDAAYFGDHPDVPVYEAESWHENAATTQVMEKHLGWIMGDMDQSELEGQRRQAHTIRAGRPDLASSTDAELLERARSLRPVCRRLFDMHINQSGAASVGPGTIGAICTELGRPEATMRILSGLGDVDSAAPSFALWHPSRLVRDEPKLTGAFDEGTEGLAARVRADASHDGFGVKLAEFLGEFGSRGPNEWDLLAPTWETDPDLVLALVDLMRAQSDEDAPRNESTARAEEREVLVSEIASLLEGDPETHAQFLAAVSSAATFVPGRERSKTNVVRVIQESRMAVNELGRRATERRDITTPSDICMLFEDELERYVNGDLDGVSDLVAARRAHYAHLVELEPPFIVNGPAPPNTTWPRKADRSVSMVAESEIIQGVPGCPGTVTGRARVIVDAADPRGLEPGEVLIAPHTDPAWTPLFVPAAAVVVDVGAALSHAIIVSRELGIPCVVSATDATKRIPDGALIRVEGDSGAVTILELP